MICRYSSRRLGWRAKPAVLSLESERLSLHSQVRSQILIVKLLNMMYFEQRLQSKLNQTFHEAHFIHDVIQVLFKNFCKKGSQL